MASRFFQHILLAATTSALAAPAAAQMSDGDRLWLQCRACHTLAEGERHKIGPNLFGIIDAPAGTRPGFTYSDALAGSGLVWDDATLDRWIERPGNVLKGHRMVYIGMKDAGKRKILIDYIRAKAGPQNAGR